MRFKLKSFHDYPEIAQLIQKRKAEILYCSALFLGLGGHPSQIAQVLFLALNSGVNSGGSQEIINSAKDQTGISHKQGKHTFHTVLSLDPRPVIINPDFLVIYLIAGSKVST